MVLERAHRSMPAGESAKLPNGPNLHKTAAAWLKMGYEWATDGLQGPESKKAPVSEGFNDKQVLDLVGCAGKI